MCHKWFFTIWWILGCFQLGDILTKGAMNICIRREPFFGLSINSWVNSDYSCILPSFQEESCSSCYLPLSFFCFFVDPGFLLLLLFSHSVVSDSLDTDCSTPGFPGHHHQLLELTRTHVHRVGDAIQPSYPLLSPSPPAFSLSQHQGLFQWVSSSHQVAEVLEFQLQHQSFQWIFWTDFF